jgi:hypothetical protein
MNGIDAHDLLHIGSSIVGLIVTVAVIKTDIRWIRKWCSEHKESDDAGFERAREDIRELRTAMREMESRR